MAQSLAALCIGFILDFILGDPHSLWHPVQGIGSLITGTEKALRKVFPNKKRPLQIAGLLLVIFVVSVSVLFAGLLLWIAERIHPALGFGLSCILCWQMLAAKSLKTESMKVYTALEKEGLEAGRRAVSMIVGRDTKSLSEEGVIKAAVETVAENTSDGVTAPLFYMMLAGPLGGVFYKAINTMDSMIGYRNEKYRWLGTCAARLDDIANFIPARISALFMTAAAFMLGFDGKSAWKIYRRDRHNHSWAMPLSHSPAVPARWKRSQR